MFYFTIKEISWREDQSLKWGSRKCKSRKEIWQSRKGISDDWFSWGWSVRVIPWSRVFNLLTKKMAFAQMGNTFSTSHNWRGLSCFSFLFFEAPSHSSQRLPFIPTSSGKCWVGQKVHSSIFVVVVSYCLDSLRLQGLQHTSYGKTQMNFLINPVWITTTSTNSPTKKLLSCPSSHLHSFQQSPQILSACARARAHTHTHTHTLSFTFLANWFDLADSSIYHTFLSYQFEPCSP